MDRDELEALVKKLHDSHYTPESPHGLLHPDEAPNTNTIYKIWNDGEFTYEKGGYAYGDRSMKQVSLPIIHVSNKDTLPTFPIRHGPHSYAMLTVDECRQVRGLLRDFFEPMLPKRIEVRIDSDDTERVNTSIRRIMSEGLKVTYRSPLPRPTIFVIDALMGSSADVTARVERCLTETGFTEGTFATSIVEC